MSSNKDKVRERASVGWAQAVECPEPCQNGWGQALHDFDAAISRPLFEGRPRFLLQPFALATSDCWSLLQTLKQTTTPRNRILATLRFVSVP